MNFFSFFFPQNKEGTLQKKIAIDKKQLKKRKWKDPNEQYKYVCEAGKIMCTFCSIPIGAFKVTSNDLSLQDKFWMTNADKNGKVNMDFKGFCIHPSQQKPSAPPPPCKTVINLGPWTSYSKTHINNDYALIVKSKIRCFNSQSDLKIVHSGQLAVLDEVKPNIGKISSPYIFYKKDGTFLAGRERNADKVYITFENFDDETKKTREEWEEIKLHAVELLMDYNNLVELAAIANGEAWENKDPEDMQKRELKAIASTTLNAVINEKKKMVTQLRPNFSYARKNQTGLYKIIKDTVAKKRNNIARLKWAMEAAINALSGGEDLSKGATLWDGIDVLKKGEGHHRQACHHYFKYIKGIYDPSNLGIIFYNNAKQYGDEVKLIKPLITVKNKVTWDVATESEKTIEAHEKGNFKVFELIGFDDSIISKDQANVAYKGPSLIPGDRSVGPGHYLWYYPSNVALYEVVAQEGLSIFYTQTEKLDPNDKMFK